MVIRQVSSDLKNQLLSEVSMNRLLTVQKLEYGKRPTKVYNFEVADTHTYVVGTSQALVHNNCGTVLRHIDEQLARGENPIVTAASKVEAEQVLRSYISGRDHPGSFRNTTNDLAPQYRDSPSDWRPDIDRGRGQRKGTYHWDEANPNAPRGDHAAEGQHLQIHTWSGKVIRIFY